MKGLLALLVVASGSEDAQDIDAAAQEARKKDQLEQARKRLRDAMLAREPASPLKPEPTAGTPADTGSERSKVGQTVDKYFGTKLPPVCSRLGCYLTDDGKRFYCVNPGCQKHKKRATKHSRVKPAREVRSVFFRCPKCQSRSLDILHATNEYACLDCKHKWPRLPIEPPSPED